jgi:hypothetical protein
MQCDLKVDCEWKCEEKRRRGEESKPFEREVLGKNAPGKVFRADILKCNTSRAYPIPLDPFHPPEHSSTHLESLLHMIMHRQFISEQLKNHSGRLII